MTEKPPIYKDEQISREERRRKASELSHIAKFVTPNSHGHISQTPITLATQLRFAIEVFSMCQEPFYIFTRSVCRPSLLN